MTRPKVLVIASLGSPPYVGGIENVVDTLLQSGLREKYEFHVFDTYRVADPNRTGLEKASFARSLLLTCRARVREIRPEIVHIHFCSRSDFWKHAICLMVARQAGSRTIFHLHGGAFDAFYQAMSSWQKALTRLIFNLANRVIALSDFWKEFLSQLVPADRIRVLNNPIDCARLSPRPRATDPENPTILLLGSLGRRKGHYDLLKALPAVVARHPNVKVLLAGADEDHGAGEELRGLAQEAGLADHVEFLGPISFEPKVERLRTSTIMVLPSHGENMPISVLEGMAARVPVVSTRVGAIPEVLDEGNAGLLIEPGDWEALAESINRLLDDPVLAERIGEAGGQRARELWDVKRIAERVDELYQELLAAS